MEQILAFSLIRRWFVLELVLVLQTGLPLSALHADGSSEPWRSSLYPADWTPGYADAQGRFLHDFSYAGYHSGEQAIRPPPPESWIDVTQPPYGADPRGEQDATALLQMAIDDAGAAGGGVVYLPAGTYRITMPEDAQEALRIDHSRVVLHGAGPGFTRLFLDASQVRGKPTIRVGPAETSWNRSLPAPLGDFGRICRAPLPFCRSTGHLFTK